MNRYLIVMLFNEMRRLIFLLIIGFLLYGCSKTEIEKISYKDIPKSEERVFLQPKKIFAFPENKSGGSVSMSDDLQHFAYSYYSVYEPTKLLYLDDKGIIHEGGVSYHFFTDDNKYVYVAMKSDGEYIFIGDEKYGPYKDVTDPFSNQDGIVGYAAFDGEKWMLIFDGKKISSYDDISDADPTTDPSGKSFAFKAANIPDKNNPLATESFHVIDGKKQKSYNSVTRGKYSPKGGHFAYIALDIDRNNNKYMGYVVSDGKEFGPYDDIRGNIEFSPDGKKLAFTAKKDNEWFMVIDGKESAPSEKMPSVFVFSSDGSHYAYSVIRNGKNLLILDGKESKLPEGTNIRYIEFSPDDTRLAYSLAQNGFSGKEYVIIDNKQENEYDGVWGLEFSPDNKNFAYTGKKQNQESVIINGKEEKWYDIKQKPYAGGIYVQFSPDSKHYAYVARTENGNVIVLDGKELGIYDSIYRVIFSSDSKYLTYLYNLNNEVWYEVYDIEKSTFIR